MCRESIERVRVAIDQLSSEDREILLLRYVEQLSTRETADILDLSVPAAKTRLFRAVQRLHRRLTSGGAPQAQRSAASSGKAHS